jgi:hypothetical protein
MLEQYRETLKQRVTDITELDLLVKFLNEKMNDREEFREKYLFIDTILGREANTLERLIHSLFLHQVATTEWIQNFYIKVSGSDMQTHKLDTQFLDMFLGNVFVSLVEKVIGLVKEVKDKRL